MLAAPVLPADVVAEMQLAFPGLQSEEGAIAVGSSSIYVSGFAPSHEAEMEDLRAYRGLPDCMRPLPMLPANLAPERAERVTRAYAEAADGTLAVEVTNHSTTTVASSLLSPEEGGDDSGQNRGAMEFHRDSSGVPVFSAVHDDEVADLADAMSDSVATTPQSFLPSDYGVTATEADRSMDRTTVGATSAPPSIASEAPQPVPTPTGTDDATSTLITRRTAAEIAANPAVANWPVHWALEDAAAVYVRARSIQVDTAEPLPGTWVIPDDSVLAPLFNPDVEPTPASSSSAPGACTINPIHRPPWGLRGTKDVHTLAPGDATGDRISQCSLEFATGGGEGQCIHCSPSKSRHADSGPSD